ncbi:MAG: hypothetical protein V3V99_08650 [candidate division Zixibacteria bacterium]
MIRSIISVGFICFMLGSIISAENLKRQKGGIFSGESQLITVIFPGEKKVIINSANSLSGNLYLGAGGKNFRISYQKKMKTPNEAEAAAYADLISVEIDNQKTAITIWLRAPADAPWSGSNNSASLDVRIDVPVGCQIEINTAYFDIEAVGPFEEFVVSESLSKVTVNKVNGLTDINVSNRPLVLKNISGDLKAKNKYEKIKLENIKTGQQTAFIRNENGEISIDSFIGSIDVGTSYGLISGKRISLVGNRNRVKNVSAPIALELDSLTSGRIRVNNRYSKIVLGIAGRVDASFICKFGSDSFVKAEGFLFEPTLVYDERLEFDVGEAAAEARLSIKGDGNIIINGPDSEHHAGGN